MEDASSGDGDRYVNLFNDKRIVVTGPGGSLGRPLVNRLKSLGADVVPVFRVPRDERDAAAGVSYADLHSEITDWDAILCGASAVVHLAWSTVPSSADSDPAGDLAKNVAGTVRLAAAAARQGAKMVFLSSGGTVYGHLRDECAAEDHPTCPVSFYGLGKLTAENYLRRYASSEILDLVIVRLSNLYGPLVSGKPMFGAIPAFAKAVINGEYVKIYGGDYIIRDYVHVFDVVESLICILQADDVPEVLNVGSGRGATLSQVIEEVSEASGIVPNILHYPPRSFDVSRNVLSINLAMEVLGWRPVIDLRSGVCDVVNSVLQVR